MARRGEVQLYVVMDGSDAEVLVAVDQRDFAGWEAAPENRGELETEDGIRRVDDSHTRLRWLAWNAMRRQKKTAASWEDFHKLLCVQVSGASLADEESAGSEDEQTEGPTAA